MSDRAPLGSGAVLLTGAGRGLGADLSVGLAAAGYPIVGLGRDARALDEVREAVARGGGSFAAVVGDARDAKALDDAAALAEDRWGLYGVIANAGIAGPTAPLAEISDAEWQETFDVNVAAAFRLCRATVPILTARGAGRIILIGSVTGKRPLAGRTPYAASKLALVGLARTLALETGRHGVTVNVVSPWLLEGDRLDAVVAKQAGLSERSDEDVRAELVAGTATGRTVTADDVLATVEFLLAPRSGALTGQDMNVAAGAFMS